MRRSFTKALYLLPKAPSSSLFDSSRRPGSTGQVHPCPGRLIAPAPPDRLPFRVPPFTSFQYNGLGPLRENRLGREGNAPTMSKYHFAFPTIARFYLVAYSARTFSYSIGSPSHADCSIAQRA